MSVSSFANEDPDVQFSDAELAQMLAPIALYPDALLTHVLIASTYPLEVIEAQRWLSTRESLSKKKIAKQSESLSWDASIKALLPFPTIVNKLSEDIDWMQNLGDAFLQEEENVISTIQLLRQQAEDAGSLAKMDNVQVVKEKKIIIIEPAETEVIYVPYYDTRVVYGNWRWRHYPPVYWSTPRYYGYNRGPFYWNSGVHIGFKFFFGGFHWHNRHVVIDHSYPRKHYPRKRISTSHHAKRWYHKPVHRKGVAYRSKKMKHKYSSSRVVSTPMRKKHSPHKIRKVSNDYKNKGRITKATRKNNHPLTDKAAKPRHEKFKQKLIKRTDSKHIKHSKKVIARSPNHIPKRERNERYTNNHKQVSKIKHTKVVNTQKTGNNKASSNHNKVKKIAKKTTIRGNKQYQTKVYKHKEYSTKSTYPKQRVQAKERAQSKPRHINKDRHKVSRARVNRSERIKH